MSSKQHGAQASATVQHVIGVSRWPGVLALLVIGALYWAISGQRTIGPPWLLPSVIGVLVTALVVARVRQAHRWVRWFALGGVGVVTVALVASAGLLVTQLLGGRTNAPLLLRDAALLWVVNIGTFALWYWEIDGGGPARRRQTHHTSTDFLFPQMTQNDAQSQAWSPRFVDYVFLAFTTSTALSPTDTLVLSRMAKVLMMLQAVIALVVLAVLAARAINTL